MFLWNLTGGKQVIIFQAVQKCPDARLPKSFVIEAYLEVRLNDEG